METAGRGWGYRVLGALAGVVFGLGAPVGAMLLRAVLVGDFSFWWLRNEFFEYFFFYVYSLFLTPVFFGILGFTLGLLSDHLSDRSRSLQKALGAMRELAIHDDLTGLYNHRQIFDELSKELERSRRHGQSLCGLMIDLDNFKEINDRYGHLAGDVVLRECAKLLKTHLRRIDVLGRYGGDEFMAILPATTSSTAVDVAERLRASVSEHIFRVFKHPVHLSVSVGLLAFEKSAQLTPRTFIEQTDKALFEAKKLGRNRVCEYAKETADKPEYVATSPGESETDS